MVLKAGIGIVLIGVINITVSFSLAILVAIRARGIRLMSTGSLIVYLIKQFFIRPLAFFIPTKGKQLNVKNV
jgi:site-specific recombinase